MSIIRCVCKKKPQCLFITCAKFLAHLSVSDVLLLSKVTNLWNFYHFCLLCFWLVKTKPNEVKGASFGLHSYSLPLWSLMRLRKGWQEVSFSCDLSKPIREAETKRQRERGRDQAIWVILAPSWPHLASESKNISQMRPKVMRPLCLSEAKWGRDDSL